MVVVAMGVMHKTTFIYEIVYHIFRKLFPPVADILANTTLKLIQPLHWYSDNMNTMQTAILVPPQRNSIELAPLNRCTVSDKWQNSS
jgi:hypothetical protein